MAFKVEVDTREARAAARAIASLPQPLTRNLAASLKLAAQDVLTEARRLLAGASRRGRPRAGQRHVVSLAGQPPARWTGRLAGSLRARQGRRDGLSQVVDARAPHAHLLELGHRMVINRGARAGQAVGAVAPRPFLTRALQNRADHINRRLAAALEATLEAAAKS